jgi:hypothetical protein
MRFFLLTILVISLISCATEKPMSVPGDQAMGLTKSQGDNFMSAIKDGSSMVFGNGYFFCIKAPSGWTIDQSSGANNGLPAVFYEEGNSWGKASNVMYTQIWDKENNDSLESIIEQDIKNYKKGYPGLVVEDKPDIVTAKGIIAKVKGFTGGSKSAYEAIAYFDEPRIVVMLIFQSLNKDDFDKRYIAFNELIRSYNYIGEFGVPPKSN